MTSRCLCGLAILLFCGEGQSEQMEFAINSGTKSYDSHPCMSIADDGTTWTAWHSYTDSREQIKVRHWPPITRLPKPRWSAKKDPFMVRPRLWQTLASRYG